MTGVPASAQQIVRWDTALFDQPGQRSLFLRTPNGGRLGVPLGAGDVNGDGREDALLCPFEASEAFLFFSPPVIAGTRESVPEVGQVTRISGAPNIGVECSAGDVNGDGLADLVLGAPSLTVPGRPGVGAVFIVFGGPALPAEINVASAAGVLRIVGRDAGDHFGVWVETVDVDGDAIEDLLIGAPDADGPANDRPDAGEAVIAFAGPDLVGGSLEIAALDVSGRVFTAYGADPSDKAGSAIDAGRIDGDVVTELVVGSALNRAAQAVFGSGVGGGDGPGESRSAAGEIAIVFAPSRGGSVDLRTPAATTAIVVGADPGDFAGEEVDVGDADGDGFGDVLIGALTARGQGNLIPNVGEAYLIYGGDGLRGARIDLRQPPAGVTTIFGPTAGGITGDTARFIDVDGDGREDVFIGSPTGTFLGPDGRSRTGALFFVRSPAGQLPAVIDLDDPPVESLPFGVILAADPGDILSYSLTPIEADGDGLEDVLVNGMTAAGLNNQFPAAGEAYVIDGQTLAARLEPFATGDLNGDGRADVADLQRVLAALVGRIQLSDSGRRTADTNGNGQLDEGDVIGIVDRILERNILAPGTLAGSGLGKRVETPDYRYESGARRLAPGYDVSGAFSPGTFTGGVLSLVSPVEPSRGSGQGTVAATRQAESSGLSAVRVTFAVSGKGRSAPRVVAYPGVRIEAAVAKGELRVIAWSENGLPLDRPLFAVSGLESAPQRVMAATMGGSLRNLKQGGATRAGRRGVQRR